MSIYERYDDRYTKVFKELDKYDLTNVLIDCWNNNYHLIEEVIESICKYISNNSKLVSSINYYFDRSTAIDYLQEKYNIKFEEVTEYCMMKPEFKNGGDKNEDRK